MDLIEKDENNLPGQVREMQCHSQNSNPNQLRNSITQQVFINNAERYRQRRSSHDIRTTTNLKNFNEYEAGPSNLKPEKQPTSHSLWPQSNVTHSKPLVPPISHPQRFRSNSNKSLPHIVRLNSVTSLRNHASSRKRSAIGGFGIEFGFASGESPPNEKNMESPNRKSASTISGLDDEDPKEIGIKSVPSTSIQKDTAMHFNDEELCGISYEISDSDPRRHSSESQHMAVYYIRQKTKERKRIIQPVYCNVPLGSQVNIFLQALPISQREAIKKFVEREKREPREEYLWIQEDASMKITVLSLKSLENFFAHERVRRVKWRHLSMDKISVYRYSLPIISTKFRLRCAHFLARNYRCCILGVWCLIIMCVSVGIVLSVVFGSTPHSKNSASYQTNPGGNATNDSGNGYQSILPIAFRQPISRSDSNSVPRSRGYIIRSETISPGLVLNAAGFS